MSDLIEKLARNARFYEHEAVALKEDETRRDNRNLGWREAKAIADLLTEAVGGNYIPCTPRLDVVG